MLCDEIEPKQEFHQGQGSATVTLIHLLLLLWPLSLSVFVSVSLSWGGGGGGVALTVVHKFACKPHRRDSVFWDLIISHTFIVWPVPLYLISRAVSSFRCVPVPLSTGPVPELGFGCRVTVTHGTATRWDWHNETVTLSVSVLILSWDCYSVGLWHSQCYSVCPSPDFVMGLLLDGTVTQWVLPCLSQS